MNIALVLSIVFGLIGLVGLIYTIYYGRSGIKKKLLVYEITRPIAIAQAFSPEDDYTLAVVFQKKGSPVERIESVYTTFLKFANFGKEPIRGSDIAPTNPIKISIEGTRALDISIAGFTRKVSNITLKNQIVGDTQASANVDFDFLDFQDGGLVKILTVGSKGKISITGDVIGMPDGITDVEKFNPKHRERITDKSWFVLSVLVLGLILSGLIYYWVTRTWVNVWLLIVPVGIFVLEMAIMITSESWSWPRTKLSFPTSLDLPKWCRPLFYQGMMFSNELLNMNMEEKDDEEDGKEGKIRKKEKRR